MKPYKAVLLTAVSAAAISINSKPANALLEVLDLSSLAQQIKAYTLGSAQLKTAVDTFNTATSTLREVQRDVQEVTQIYDAASHITNVAGLMPLLGQFGIQDPLPISVYSMENVFNSRGNFGSLLNSLGSFGSNYSGNVSKNTLFTWLDPVGAKPMGDRINAVSAEQGAGETVFNASQQRMPAIRSLINQLNTTKDPAEREALMVRLQGEGVLTQATTNETLSAMMMADAANKNAELRAEQERGKSEYTWIDEAKATTGTW